MSAQNKFPDGLQSIPSMVPAAYCVPLGNTELIPGQKSDAGRSGLGTINALGGSDDQDGYNWAALTATNNSLAPTSMPAATGPI